MFGQTGGFSRLPSASWRLALRIRRTTIRVAGAHLVLGMSNHYGPFTGTRDQVTSWRAPKPWAENRGRKQMLSRRFSSSLSRLFLWSRSLGARFLHVAHELALGDAAVSEAFAFLRGGVAYFGALARLAVWTGG